MATAETPADRVKPASAPKRPIDRMFAAYGADHQHPVNVAMHCVAVPLIAWSVAALVASLPAPDMLRQFGFNWAWPLVVAALVYYASLGSWRITGAMALWAALFLLPIHIYPAHWPITLPMVAGIVFVIAWAIQFIGHYIEGRRPSFLHDLEFLLVGPAWVMAHVFQALGIKW